MATQTQFKVRRIKIFGVPLAVYDDIKETFDTPPVKLDDTHAYFLDVDNCERVMIHASKRATAVNANDAERRHADSDDAGRRPVDTPPVSAPALSLASLSAALPALGPSSSLPAPVTSVLARPAAQPAMPQGVPPAVVARPSSVQGIAACRVKGYHGPQAERLGRLNPSVACENPACRCTDRLLAHARCATCGFVYCGPCFGMGNGSRALKFARPSRLARKDDRAARFGGAGAWGDGKVGSEAQL